MKNVIINSLFDDAASASAAAASAAAAAIASAFTTSEEVVLSTAGVEVNVALLKWSIIELLEVIEGLETKVTDEVGVAETDAPGVPDPVLVILIVAVLLILKVVEAVPESEPVLEELAPCVKDDVGVRDNERERL